MAKYAKPKSSSAPSAKKKSIMPWLIAGGALFLLLIVGVVMLSNRGASGAAEIAPPDVPAEWVNRNVLGNPDAPVTVQTWEDFLCPACEKWASDVEPILFRDYIQSGDVKLEFRHFPLQIHSPGSELGAMASECAADQGAFWPYHDRIFREAANRGQPALQMEKLVDYAGDLGLDEKQFLQCLSGQTHRDAVTASVTEAITMGLNSTPSILVDGQLMDNPFDYNALKTQIDQQLEAANAGS